MPMAYPKRTREWVRQLRREESLSLDELARRAAVPRGTVYRWVRDLPIATTGPGGGFSEVARSRGTEVMRDNWRRTREVAYLAGLEAFAELRGETGFRAFVTAYTASGRRHGHQVASFAHSDPSLVRLARYWLLTLGRNRLRYRLQLPPGSDPTRARNAWAQALAIPSAA
ncbi:MAG TPA: hypothetical protein VFC52_07125, partial [Solirubrobacterales bacterium]|nr:hypothetical protein [Solirubrobacterales bacterium]